MCGLVVLQVSQRRSDSSFAAVNKPVSEDSAAGQKRGTTSTANKLLQSQLPSEMERHNLYPRLDPVKKEFVSSCEAEL